VDEPVTGRLVGATVGAAVVCEALADGLVDFEGVGDMLGDLDGDFDGVADFVGVRIGDGLFDFSWSPSCPYPGWAVYWTCCGTWPVAAAAAMLATPVDSRMADRTNVPATATRTRRGAPRIRSIYSMPFILFPDVILLWAGY
jgi:hypothetical protein